MTTKSEYMRNIGKIFLSAIVISLAVACGSASKEKKGDLLDKKAQLEKLKKDKTKIDDDIRNLENEISKLDSSSNDKAKLVSAAPVTQQNFTHYIELQGKVDANDVVIVTPRGMPAQVKEIHVKRGDMVKKGDLLLKLDDAVMLQQVDGLKTQLEYAKNIYNRQKNLWDQGIGTEVQLITAKNNVDALEKQIATLTENWRTSFVYAPISGLADVVDIKQGEIFNGATASGPQIRIVNGSNMKVITEVPENYANSVKKGAVIEIEIPDINKTYNSVISVMGASINPNSRGFSTEAKIPSDAMLRISQVALVRIKDYAAPDAITVPVNVVQTDESGKYVYIIVKEGDVFKARRKKVDVGQTYNGFAEVRTGLTAADQVITEGYQSVYDGQVVTTEVKQ